MTSIYFENYLSYKYFSRNLLKSLDKVESYWYFIYKTSAIRATLIIIALIRGVHMGFTINIKTDEQIKEEKRRSVTEHCGSIYMCPVSISFNEGRTFENVWEYDDGVIVQVIIEVLTKAKLNKQNSEILTKTIDAYMDKPGLNKAGFLLNILLKSNPMNKYMAFLEYFSPRNKLTKLFSEVYKFAEKKATQEGRKFDDNFLMSFINQNALKFEKGLPSGIPSM